MAWMRRRGRSMRHWGPLADDEETDDSPRRYFDEEALAYDHDAKRPPAGHDEPRRSAWESLVSEDLGSEWWRAIPADPWKG